MKKSIFKMTVLAVVALVAFGNCKKKEKDDSTQTLALLYVLDQMSGQCATLGKAVAANTYSASISYLPKGVCNLESIVGSSRAKGLENTQGFRKKTSDVYGKVPSCAAVKTVYDAKTATYTVDNFCVPLANCASDSAWTTYIEGLNGTAANTGRRYVSIGNGFENIKTTTQVNTWKTSGYTQAAIDAGVFTTMDNATIAIATTNAATDATCYKDLVAANSFLTTDFGYPATNTGTNVAASTLAKVVAFFGTCGYGSAVTTDKCVTAFTEF